LLTTYGDGWFPYGIIDPTEYARRWALLQNTAAGVGRDTRAIVAAGHIPVAIAISERGVASLLDSGVVRGAVRILTTGEQWEQRGVTHPRGRAYGGYADIVPERIDPTILGSVLSFVPEDFIREAILCGTADQIVERLRALGAVGMGHVTLVTISAMITQRTLFDTVRGLRRIASRLRSGRWPPASNEEATVKMSAITEDEFRWPRRDELKLLKVAALAQAHDLDMAPHGSQDVHVSATALIRVGSPAATR